MCVFFPPIIYVTSFILQNFHYFVCVDGWFYVSMMIVCMAMPIFCHIFCSIVISGGGLNLSDGGGTIRKSIIKNSTPWNRAGTGDGGGGSNRAARRAALKKGGSGWKLICLFSCFVHFRTKLYHFKRTIPCGLIFYNAAFAVKKKKNGWWVINTKTIGCYNYILLP